MYSLKQLAKPNLTEIENNRHSGRKRQQISTNSVISIENLICYKQFKPKFFLLKLK